LLHLYLSQASTLAFVSLKRQDIETMDSVGNATSGDANSLAEMFNTSHEAATNIAQAIEAEDPTLPDRNSGRSIPLEVPVEPSSVHSEQLTQEEIERKPWKYVGYKGYTKFIASESDFFILRRFTAASIRVALYLQDQVATLVKDLEEIDRRSSQKSAPDYHNGSFRYDENEERQDILVRLHTKMTEYSEFNLSPVGGNSNESRCICLTTGGNVETSQCSTSRYPVGKRLALE
jgi:hypothetical protein